MLRASIALAVAALSIAVPSPAQAAKKIVVTLESEPSGASVEWNGQVVGTTPFQQQFDDSFFKTPKWLWSNFLNEPITLRVWKEGYVGKEVRLTSGPFRWVNANYTAEKIYYVINSVTFRVLLEPDVVSRVARDAAAAAKAA